MTRSTMTAASAKQTVLTSLKSLAIAAVLATPSAAAPGDTVTDATRTNISEMIRIADAIDAAVDAKDWPLARSFFADTIEVDFSALVGGAPATIPADALIDGWSANLTAEKTSFHLRGNHRVTFEGPDAATIHSHGYAWNRMEAGADPTNGGEAMWEVWGTYTHSFARGDNGWTVTLMTFVPTAERGNAWVRDTPGN
ncbi:MAG: nuclear transport factor 2 family protein [Pseudomonadota bacterium]